MHSPNDSVAQLVEQLTLNQWVEGSSPSGVTDNKPLMHSVGGFFITILSSLRWGFISKVKPRVILFLKVFNRHTTTIYIQILSFTMSFPQDTCRSHEKFYWSLEEGKNVIARK